MGYIIMYKNRYGEMTKSGRMRKNAEQWDRKSYATKAAAQGVIKRAVVKYTKSKFPLKMSEFKIIERGNSNQGSVFSINKSMNFRF